MIDVDVSTSTEMEIAAHFLHVVRNIRSLPLLVLLARGIERGIPARTGRKLGFFALHHHVALVNIT